MVVRHSTLPEHAAARALPGPAGGKEILMPALSPLIVMTVALGLLGLITLAAGIASLRERRPGTGLVATLAGGLFLAVAALAMTINIGIQGYRALTRETLAATVTTERTGAQTFRATVRFPDHQIAVFALSGDELYVDAHILKWHPMLNVLGLHTAYELDRIGGRYTALEDEQERPRTVYALSQRKPVDMFHLARRYGLLRPFVDAAYGSGTFAPTGPRSAFEVRVSTSGLLLRRVTP